MALPSRLILTNLPPTLTNSLLSSHLSQCPPSPPLLTDCKILLKPDGTSRRIAFLGFPHHQEAKRVLEWVQGTWVQGTRGGPARIKADWAKDAQDAPRPKKRVKLAASPPPAAAAITTTKAQDDDEATRFADFLAVMNPRRNRAVEEDHQATMEASLPPPPPPPAPIVAASEKKKVRAEPEPKPELEKKDDGVAEDETLTDLEYMARRMKRSLEDARADDDSGSEDEGRGAAAAEWEQDEDERPATTGADEPSPPSSSDDPTRSLLLSSARIFLRNLAYTTTTTDLSALLTPFGPLAQIHLPLDRATQTPKGLAYATFERGEDAVRAWEELDGRSFLGRLLHILPAVGRNSGGAEGGGGGAEERRTTVKGERLDARKQEAGKGLSWATLYMNSDAVMSSVADRLKVDKAELLDPSSNNAAVRLALAETHVIAETKKYFENEGVDLASLATKGPRSSTTILVKNIPYNTTTGTLAALFSPFGAISRLLLPPAGTMAIVEMADAAAANDAWRGLVYKKLGSSVLYLEKAAAGVWNGTASAEASTALPTSSTTTTTAVSNNATTTKIDETSGEPGSTLFIKNLSFTTTTSTLSLAFSSLPDFLFARVQTKPDPKHPGQTLSMGFGFVGFRTVKAAESALKLREGHRLEGHALEVKFAQRGRGVEGEERKAKTTTGKGGKSSTSTKLIVKNVPFEVTRKEIRELFSAYGQLKSVRLPRKFDHKTRGFAFLDFASRRDAEAAFTALEHTHLLGRHLVLQWAEEEGETDLEGLRRKTGFSESKVGGKKAKFEFKTGAGGAAGQEMDEE